MQWLEGYCQDLGSQSVSNDQPPIDDPGINSLLPCNPNQFTLMGRLRPRILLCGDVSLELYKTLRGTITCEAYLNSKLKPLEVKIVHAYEDTLATLRAFLIEHVNSDSVALVSYSLRDLCGSYGTFYVPRDFEKNFRALITALQLYPCHGLVFAGSAECWGLSGEYDNQVEAMSKILAEQNVPHLRTGSLWATSAKNARCRSSKFHFGAIDKNQRNHADFCGPLILQVMSSGTGNRSPVYPEGAYLSSPPAQILLPTPVPVPPTSSRTDSVPTDKDIPADTDPGDPNQAPILMITPETRALAISLASKAGLSRVPAVGDFLTTRAFSPRHPEHHTAGYDDFSPYGTVSQKYRFQHSVLIGPVSETRIILYPGTQAARSPKDLQAKGRGIAVRVPHPMSNSRIGQEEGHLYVNITDNQYNVATKFADLTTAATDDPTWSNGHRSPTELARDARVPLSVSGRTKRSSPDVEQSPEKPDYRQQTLSRELFRVDIDEDDQFGGELDYSSISPDSGEAYPCLVKELIPGSLADKLGVTLGCALVIIWESDHPWVVADIDQANIRVLITQKPIALVFMATEISIQKRSQALYRTDAERQQFFLSTPTVLDYAVMDARCWAYSHSFLGRFDWHNIIAWDPDNSGNLDTIRIDTVDMTPGKPDYDNSYGNPVPFVEQTTRYNHGSPVKTAVAIIQSGRLVRGRRALGGKFGVCLAEELKALEYGFPSTFDEFSDRRYQIIFKLKVTCVWHDDKANSNYYQARENETSRHPK